jgi:hypothetical protein
VAILLLLVRSQRWKLAWLLLTISLFVGPFLLVVIQHRYLNPHVVPLTILLCVVVTLEWRRESAATTPTDGPPSVSKWRAVAAWVILGMFVWSSVEWIIPLFNKSSSAYRQLGHKLEEHGLSGPFVCESRNRGILVAFHSRDKFAGFPATREVAAADKLIRDAGVNYMIIFDNVNDAEVAILSPSIIERPGWNFVFATKNALVYRLGGTGPTTRPTRPIRVTTRPTQLENGVLDDADDDQPQKPRPRSRKAPRK